MMDYPEVALIEAFKDGMVPSLKQMIMVTRDTLPTTLKTWQDWPVRLDQNREPMIQNLVESRKGKISIPG